MAERLHVDPDHLHRTGENLLQAASESMSAHGAHHSDMEAAAPGLPVEAASALSAMVASWTEQRDALHRRIEEMGSGSQEAAARYAAVDVQKADTIAKLDMGL